MKIWLYCASFTAALGGCTIEPREMDAPGLSERSLTADLRNAAGQVKAQASASDGGGGIRVRLEANGMPAGAYGAHIHMAGGCDAPGFESAGGHWNPTAMQHGKSNPQGMHKGDLPNLMVGSDGHGSMEITIAQASIAGGAMPLMDADGAAIVVHTAPDDYRTDPSGNSGARIACGVFR